jgi:hypothetical protein
MEITFETIEASAIDEDIFEDCLVNSMDAIKWVWIVGFEDFKPVTNDSSLAEKKAKFLEVWKNTNEHYGEQVGEEWLVERINKYGKEKTTTDMILFVCKVDGYIVEYHTGWPDDEGNDQIFHQHAGSISRPDQNGSSAWRVREDYALSLLNFCRTQCSGESPKTDMWAPKNSQKWELFKSHQEDGHLTYTIDEEMILTNDFQMDKLVIDL